SIRPPALRLRDGKREAHMVFAGGQGLMQLLRGKFFMRTFYDDVISAGLVYFQREIGFQRCLRVGELLLAEPAVVYLRLVPGFQVNGAPDAAGNEARAPVPPVMVGRFAGEYA